jgi:hypothetical protein
MAEDNHPGYDSTVNLPRSALLQQDRLAGLGQLVGSLVHSVNNQMGAIMGYTDLLMLNPASKIFQNELQQIMTSCNNGLELARSLAVVRNSLTRQPGVVDAAKVVTSLLYVFGQIYHSKAIEVQREAPESLSLYGRVAEFTQAALHCINLSYRILAESSLSPRKLKCVLTGGDAGVKLRMEISCRFFESAPLLGQDPPSPDEAGFDLWVVAQLCSDVAVWRFSDSGSILELDWPSNPADGSAKFVF